MYIALNWLIATYVCLVFSYLQKIYVQSHDCNCYFSFIPLVENIYFFNFYELRLLNQYFCKYFFIILLMYILFSLVTICSSNRKQQEHPLYCRIELYICFNGYYQAIYPDNTGYTVSYYKHIKYSANVLPMTHK